MRVCFVKSLNMIGDNLKEYKFQRMKRYELPKRHAEELISQGYCFEYGFMNGLEVSK